MDKGYGVIQVLFSSGTHEGSPSDRDASLRLGIYVPCALVDVISLYTTVICQLCPNVFDFTQLTSAIAN